MRQLGIDWKIPFGAAPLSGSVRHINNAEMKAKIRAAIEALGYECPIICSPEELGGIES